MYFTGRGYVELSSESNHGPDSDVGFSPKSIYLGGKGGRGG